MHVMLQFQWPVLWNQKKKCQAFNFLPTNCMSPGKLKSYLAPWWFFFCEKWPYFITSFFPDWLFGTCGSISHSKNILWCVDDTQWYCNWEVKSKCFWYIHTGRSRGAWAPLVFRPNWGPKADLPTLTVPPWVSQFFVISHGLTTRLLNLTGFGKNHSEMI